MSRRFWSTFLLICSFGVFIFFASGIKWGTANCGLLSVLTMVAALVAGAAVANLD
jgi:hypothetical protein